MTERREAPRVTVELWVEESHDKETYFQHASNLSTGGLFLEGTLPHEPGTIVCLRFTLPGEGQSIEIRAEIVNVAGADGRGMGLHFLDLTEPDRLRLERFVGRASRPPPAA